MKWILLWAILGSNYGGINSSSGSATFDDEAACNRAKNAQIQAVGRDQTKTNYSGRHSIWAECFVTGSR